MKALVLTGPRKLEIRDLPNPVPGPDEVVVDVKACGVCGTDIHLFEGQGGAFANEYPLIMGHEYAGIVSAAGENVRHVSIGDHVSIDPNLYCGVCEPCREGSVHFCERMTGYGTTKPGGFAEKSLVNARAVYKVPDSLPFEVAAMMEPVSCCLHGIDRSGIQPGSVVLVIGAGSIGQMMLMLALKAGAAKVVVFELDAAKREKAVSSGAAAAYGTDEASLANYRKDHPEPVSSVIECVGKKVTMELALRLASRQATIMLFGLAPQGERMDIFPFDDLFKKELTLTASFINPFVASRVIRLLQADAINMDQVITDRIPLSESVKIFTDSSYRKRGKIIVTPSV